MMLNLIQDFLALKRFAFVGLSRKPQHFSRKLFREFLKRGYDVVPVNPHARNLEGHTCYGSVGEIVPSVPAALVLTSSIFYKRIILDCAEAGVPLVWLYGIAGPTRDHEAAIALCKDLSLRCIAGYCPYMFFETTAFPHRIHGVIAKLLRQYPSS